MSSSALHFEFHSLRCGSTCSKYGARDPAGCTRKADAAARSIEAGDRRDLRIVNGAPARRDVLATRMWRALRAIMSAAVGMALADAWPSPAAAEKIEAALARAYQNNPQLNAQRATVRQTDEGVPQALSGYRPTISANASAGKQYIGCAGQPS